MRAAGLMPCCVKLLPGKPVTARDRDALFFQPFLLGLSGGFQVLGPQKRPEITCRGILVYRIQERKTVDQLIK